MTSQVTLDPEMGQSLESVIPELNQWDLRASGLLVCSGRDQVQVSRSSATGQHSTDAGGPGQKAIQPPICREHGHARSHARSHAIHFHDTSRECTTIGQIWR